MRVKGTAYRSELLLKADCIKSKSAWYWLYVGSGASKESRQVNLNRASEGNHKEQELKIREDFPWGKEFSSQMYCLLMLTTSCYFTTNDGRIWNREILAWSSQLWK